VRGIFLRRPLQTQIGKYVTELMKYTTKPTPYLIWGIPLFFWIPAGVYPVLDTGQE
jgi:hypothetical protein